MDIITVLEAFTEVRTGRSYQPGEVISDPQWHAAGDRKAEAYAARGKVRIEPADGGDKKEASAAGKALAQRKKQEGK